MSHLQQVEFIGGQKLYAMQIVGNFNKIPVQRVTDGVVASLDDSVDIDLHQFNFLKRFATAASDRGSMIIMDEKILPGDILFIEVEDGVTTAYQFIKVDQVWYLKIWVQVGTQTTVKTFSGFFPESYPTIDDLKKALLNASPIESLEVGDVLIIENQNGILIPARATILRLAELMGLVGQAVSSSSLKWFLPGWVGDTSRLKTSEDFMPVPPDVDPKSAANPAFIDAIFKEIQMLLPFYFQTTSSYTLMPRESGISRYLNMQGYINRVKLTQRLAAFVMNEIFGVTLTFSNLIFNLTLETAEGNTGGSIASVESQSQDVV